MRFVLLCSFASAVLSVRVVKRQTALESDRLTSDADLEENDILVSSSEKDTSVVDTETEATSLAGRRRDRRRRSRRRDSDGDPPRRREPPRRRSGGDPPRRRASGGGGGSGRDFLFLGDFGFGSDKQKACAKGLAKVASDVKPTVIFAMGDNIYGGDISSSKMVSRFVDIYPNKYSSLRVPWYGMTGNHDWKKDARAEVNFTKSSKNTGGYWNFPSLYYKKSFKTPGGKSIDFFILDSYQYRGESSATKYLGSSAQGKHKQWLDNELGSSTADYKVVLSHHPAYAWSRDKKKIRKTGHSNVQDVLKKHNIPLYISGHYHHQEMLQATSGLRTVITGGGGQRTHSSCEDKSSKLAYCSGGGFLGARFFDNGTAELKLYGCDGSFKYSVKTSVSASSMMSSTEDVPSEESVSMEGDFEPYSASGPGSVFCNGAELVEVDRVCAADRCTVTTDRWEDTCEEYCAINGLSCVGGWTQHEEDSECVPSEDIGCQQVAESMHNKMCQCA